MFVNIVFLSLMLFVSGSMRPGQLVWRRLQHCPSPSSHAIRSTCMQVLPLVEMFCRWELQEDCSNLQVLMERFESVAELESHGLGRSLLCMVRDEDDRIRSYSERRNPLAAPPATADAFHAVRQRLAAVDIAFQGLQPQVHIEVGHAGLLASPRHWQSALGRVFFFLRHMHCHGTLCSALLCPNCNTISHSLAYTCMFSNTLGFRFLSKAMNTFGFLCRLCVPLDDLAPALCCVLLPSLLLCIVHVQCQSDWNACLFGLRTPPGLSLQ